MFGTKPMAALSAGLLARKGEARPAMRRADTLSALASAGDALGWNDMGDGAPPAALPPVLAARERLAVELEATPTPRAATLPPGKRVAFTLRLDGERHRRLRQAAAAGGVSAQALLTEALDRLTADAA
jgi:hypothetical protein